MEAKKKKTKIKKEKSDGEGAIKRVKSVVHVQACVCVCGRAAQRGAGPPHRKGPPP